MCGDLPFVVLYTDIDECLIGTQDCDVHGFCNDTDGSYNCTCLQGYEGDGFNCSSNISTLYVAILMVRNYYHLSFSADVNECMENLDSCDDNATCSDTDGDFNCTCNIGYEGDGFNCSS